jgi:hypothetical protein
MIDGALVLHVILNLNILSGALAARHEQSDLKIMLEIHNSRDPIP